jgi:hypothetical protein
MEEHSAVFVALQLPCGGIAQITVVSFGNQLRIREIKTAGSPKRQPDRKEFPL